MCIRDRLPPPRARAESPRGTSLAAGGRAGQARAPRLEYPAPMPYISEPTGERLSEQARRQQEKLGEQMGYVPNYARFFGHRPDVLAAWGQLIAAIRGHMDQRRYELVTIAAARALRSSYCQLAHSSVLLDAGTFTEAELCAVARDYERAGLTAAEVAMLSLIHISEPTRLLSISY